MADQVGTLVAKVVADVEGFRTDMNKAAALAQSFAGRMNKALASINTSFTTLKQGAASLGIVFSARMFASWIKGSLDARNMTEEQLKATERARAALDQLRGASDSLGQALGGRLAPSMSVAARAMGDLAAIISGDAQANVDRKLRALNETIAVHEDYLQRTGQKTDTLIEKFKAERLELEKLAKGYANAAAAASLKEISIKDFVGKDDRSHVALPRRMSKEEMARLGMLSMPSFEPVAAPTIPRMSMPDGMKMIDQRQIDANESIKANEIELTQFYNEQALARKQAMINAQTEWSANAQSVAQEEIAARQMVTNQAIGLLSALGAEHRGAAIAALVLQKVNAGKEIVANAAASKALIAQNTAVAISKAYAQLGPIGGLAATPKILAMSASSLATVSSSTAMSLGLLAATGAVEAMQLSSGGTQSTLGTSANPINTTTNAGSSAAAQSIASHSQKVVEFHVYGNVYGAGGMRKLLEDAREVIDGADVIIFGPDSRQAHVISRP